MILSREKASTQLEWKFLQVLGDRNLNEELQDVDIVSTIEFEKNGDYFAVGDRGGRVIIFETVGGKNTPNRHIPRNELEQKDYPSTSHPGYRYKTEFQSHEPEFDYLKSLEIEEKINRIRWCPAPNGSMFILSTNDKTIKLWKVKDQKVKKIKEMVPFPLVSSENTLLAEKSFMNEHSRPSVSNGHHLEWTENMVNYISTSQDVHTKIANMGDTAYARCQKVYAHAHDFKINSISNNSDGETYISADDLRINLWNLEISDQCFNIVDMKPPNMDDLTEVITSAEFHPIYCNLLAYSSSRGFIRLVDMRQSALCDHSARILQDGESRGSKSFFTELVASISDIKFANDGRFLLSRDYMNLKLWDVHMDSTPVATFKIHEHLRPKLCDLYNNDSIFDKFECCISGDGLHFATGSYSNLLCIFSHGNGSGEGITVDAGKIKNRKSVVQAASAPRARRSSLSNLMRGFYWQGREDSSSDSNEFSCNLNSKLLHSAWHPTTNLIACARENSLFLYYA